MVSWPNRGLVAASRPTKLQVRKPHGSVNYEGAGSRTQRAGAAVSAGAPPSTIQITSLLASYFVIVFLAGAADQLLNTLGG